MFSCVGNWRFLTSHARVLLCIARDPGVRLRDIAASAGITERSAHGIITDLTQAGYLAKQKDGRRNRYQIRAHLPLPEPASRQRTIGEVIDLLAADADAIPTTASGDATDVKSAGSAPVRATWHKRDHASGGRGKLPGLASPGPPPHPQGGHGERGDEYDNAYDQQVQQAFCDHADDPKHDRRNHQQ
jgi:hypothetical protein